MADVPRDPRQLARDILAGRISIEELAREQQRRAAGGAQRPPEARLPERVPLPRPVPPPPRPVIRQVPPAPQRPTARPPVVVKNVPQRRPQPQPQPAKPSARAITPQAPAAPVAPVAPSSPKELGDSYAGAVKANTVAVRVLDIQKIVRSRAALRQCIFMNEVLGKPLALREEFNP